MADIPRIPADVEKILAEDRFLRSLAASLVGPGPDADDAAQHTWLRSLEHPPKRAGSLRAFLGTVLKNHVRRQMRAEDRRSRHEQAGTFPGTLSLTMRRSSSYGDRQDWLSALAPLVLTFLTDPPVLRRILEHLGLPADPPPVTHARPPPELQLS